MRANSDIAIVSAWYPPEPAPFGHMMQELARFLATRGLTVDVFTSVPNHPQGAVYPGWNNRWLQHERPMERLLVWRVKALASRNASQRSERSKYRRIAAHLVFSFLTLIALLTKSRPRLIFSVLQPLSIGAVLSLVARLKGSRLIFNVQDLHPDAAVQLGLIKSAVLISALRRMEASAYRRADALTVICDAFKDHCVSRGALAARVRVIPNWIDLEEVVPLSRPSELRGRLPIPRNAFIALYAGTVGLVSGAEIVLEAASRLAPDASIHFAFVGDGPLLNTLVGETERRQLKNVHFLPFQPREQINDVQALGDVALVTLRPGAAQNSVPSKVLGYMAAARPVIASVDLNSETAHFIGASDAGIVVCAGDIAGLVEAILKLRADPALACELGRSGRRYLENHLAKDRVLTAYATLLEGEIEKAG